jgi:hypothetical protein
MAYPFGHNYSCYIYNLLSLLIMEAVWIGIIFIFWYAFALFIAERFDGRSRLGKQWLFFISFMFSPIVGYLLVIFTKK